MSVAIKLPPNWCKATLNFCSLCYNLSEIFSFLSLNMDFVLANSADPDEMTHRVAFHLSLPCSIKYPIRGFWYTKDIQRFSISYIRVQKLPCFTTDQIRYSFYCGRLSHFLSNDERFQRRFQQFPYLPKATPPGCHVFEGPSLFYQFCSGPPRKYPCQILFNSDD